MRFIGWKGFAEQANKSVSSLKRDAADDRYFPIKIILGPNRVGFAAHHIDAWCELLLVRELELRGAYVSQRKRELEEILRGSDLIDPPEVAAA